jgi:hypothetical protein
MRSRKGGVKQKPISPGSKTETYSVETHPEIPGRQLDGSGSSLPRIGIERPPERAFSRDDFREITVAIMAVRG